MGLSRSSASSPAPFDGAGEPATLRLGINRMIYNPFDILLIFSCFNFLFDFKLIVDSDILLCKQFSMAEVIMEFQSMFYIWTNSNIIHSIYFRLKYVEKPRHA